MNEQSPPPEHLRDVSRDPLPPIPPLPLMLALRVGGAAVASCLLIVVVRLALGNAPGRLPAPAVVESDTAALSGDVCTRATYISLPYDGHSSLLGGSNSFDEHVEPTGYAWTGVDRFYAFDLVRGQTVTIRVDDGGTFDAGAYVTTSCDDLVESLVAGRDISPSSPLEFVAKTTGRHILVVDSYGDATEGTYSLAIAIASGTASSAPAPMAPTGPASPARRYPVRCTADALGEGLVMVAGADDLCIPTREAAVVASTSELPRPPSGYDDDEPVSLLLGPRAVLDEESALTSAERERLAADVRSTQRHSWSLGSACDATWTAAVGRLSLNCEFSDYYVTGTPRVERHQECETMPGSSCGECESSSDCDGFFCGCPSSRCFFGQCTGCPSVRMCDDPTYDVSVPAWSVRTTFAEETQRSLAARAVEERGFRLLIGARVNRAFRDVRSRRPSEEEIRGGDYERGDTVIEHDTEYILGLEPTYVGYVGCVDDCDPAAGVDVLDLLTRRGSTYALVHTDGRRVRVSCTSGVCTGRLDVGGRSSR